MTSLTDEQLRVVALFFFDKGKTGVEAAKEIRDAYGEEAVTDRWCQKWFKRFREGNRDVEDRPRAGRPRELEPEALLALLDQDPTQTTRDLAEALGVTNGTVWNRLKEMGKVSKLGRWVPHVLTDQNKWARYEACTQLKVLDKNRRFLNRIITGDEKWILYDNPKRKRSWVDANEPGPSVPRRDIHSKKVMLCVWWDMEGVLYYELLKPGETVTAERYAQQLTRLSEVLDAKRPFSGRGGRKVWLLHDNARPHVAERALDAIRALGWFIIPHPAYSPDLAPSDFHLFRALQNDLDGQRFTDYDQLKNWLDQWFNSRRANFYADGIRNLRDRWDACLAHMGDYFPEH